LIRAWSTVTLVGACTAIEEVITSGAIDVVITFRAIVRVITVAATDIIIST
jgi:hypothetical protein